MAHNPCGGPHWSWSCLFYLLSTCFCMFESSHLIVLWNHVVQFMKIDKNKTNSQNALSKPLLACMFRYGDWNPPQQQWKMKIWTLECCRIRTRSKQWIKPEISWPEFCIPWNPKFHVINSNPMWDRLTHC